MLNFTQEERQAIVFVSAMVLIGIGVNFWAKRFFPVQSIPSLNQDLGKINLNTADKDLLMNMPGIGEKSAQHIIEYRQSQSGFLAIEELLKVKGISPAKYELIKDHLRIK
jgi:competence ComEA-like helix-hairpin-helix protein